MELRIDRASADALVKLADSIPPILADLKQSNSQVLSCYDQVQQTIGPHTAQVMEIIRKFNKGLEETSKDIDVLPPMLRELADNINAILGKPINIENP